MNVYRVSIVVDIPGEHEDDARDRAFTFIESTSRESWDATVVDLPDENVEQYQLWYANGAPR